MAGDGQAHRHHRRIDLIGSGCRLRQVLAALDPSHEALEPLGRLRAQVRIVHAAKPLPDGKQRLGAQSNDVVPFRVVVRQRHLGPDCIGAHDQAAAEVHQRPRRGKVPAGELGELMDLPPGLGQAGIASAPRIIGRGRGKNKRCIVFRRRQQRTLNGALEYFAGVSHCNGSSQPDARVSARTRSTIDGARPTLHAEPPLPTAPRNDFDTHCGFLTLERRALQCLMISG
jgi:hypothetical protein